MVQNSTKLTNEEVLLKTSNPLKTTTKKPRIYYEQYLSDMALEDVRKAFEDYIYFCNPERGKFISERKLRTIIKSGSLGPWIHKLDPIAFEVGYQDWRVR
jgi:hypothetical protein